MRDFELELGIFYKLPHGIGRLLGKQRFNSEGKEISLDTKDLSGNEFTSYIFEIDHSTRWSKLMGSTKYRAWGDQIVEIKNPLR